MMSRTPTGHQYGGSPGSMTSGGYNYYPTPYQQYHNPMMPSYNNDHSYNSHSSYNQHQEPAHPVKQPRHPARTSAASRPAMKGRNAAATTPPVPPPPAPELEAVLKKESLLVPAGDLGVLVGGAAVPTPPPPAAGTPSAGATPAAHQSGSSTTSPTTTGGAKANGNAVDNDTCSSGVVVQQATKGTPRASPQPRAAAIAAGGGSTSSAGPIENFRKAVLTLFGADPDRFDGFQLLLNFALPSCGFHRGGGAGSTGAMNGNSSDPDGDDCPVVINLHEAIPDGEVPLSNSKKIKMWVSQNPDRNLYIGRPSIWGNPYRIGEHGDDREDVVRKYRNYLVYDHPEILAHIGELRGKVLGCWCHPAPCHGHVLVSLYKSRKSRMCRNCID